ncbi:MAG: hypothetical protein ACTS5F_00835 [Candidatus Hodgkinia cicadicola]
MVIREVTIAAFNEGTWRTSEEDSKRPQWLRAKGWFGRRRQEAQIDVGLESSPPEREKRWIVSCKFWWNDFFAFSLLFVKSGSLFKYIFCKKVTYCSKAEVLVWKEVNFVKWNWGEFLFRKLEMGEMDDDNKLF